MAGITENYFIPLSYSLFLSKEHLLLSARNTERPSNVFNLERNSSHLQNRSRWLRRTLRSHPTWCKGHFELARSEIIKLHLSKEKKDGRSIATIRSSAKALLALDGEEPEVKLKSKMLFAFSDFFSNDFEGAKDKFFSVAASPQASMLIDTDRALVCEYGAASAMSLCDEGEAKAILETIPEHLRTQDVLTMLQYLKTKQG